MNQNSCLDHRACVLPIFDGTKDEIDGRSNFTLNLYRGSGFLIRKSDRTFFVTASHVVDPSDIAENAGFVLYFGRPNKPDRNDHCGVPRSEFVHHRTADIAYVDLTAHIQKTALKPLPLAQEPLSLGQGFFTVGYPFTAKDSPTSISLEQFVFRGSVVSRYDEERANKLKIYRPATWNCVLSIEMAKGLSGAPILSDDNEKRIFQVVGMVYGTQQISIGEDTYRFGIGTELSELSEIGETW